MADLSGSLILNRYRVDEFIGKGGMAEVYKVWDNQRAADLAMKVLHADLAEDKIFLRRFKREAQTLSKLQHPNIVRCYGLEQSDDFSFILMDYIEGTTLRKEIYRAKNSFTLERVLEIMKPVCSALHYAHAQGITHCDIKPANIMLHKNGSVLLSDFGIARMTEATTATMVGAGTPAYMSPEQARGADPIPQTDIYALGIVLYEMLTGGERPFTGENARVTGSTSEKIRWEQVNTPPPALRHINPEISPALESVILKCLQKDPAQRYPSALDLLNALTQAAGNTTVRYAERTDGISDHRPPLDKQKDHPATDVIQSPVPVEQVNNLPHKRRNATPFILGTALLILILFFMAISKPYLLTFAFTETPSPTPKPTLTDTLVPKTATPIIETLTPSFTITSSIDNWVGKLLPCKEPKLESCYNVPNSQNGVLLITIWIKNFDKTTLPYIVIGTTRFVCKVSSYYDDTISCSHEMITSKTWDINLFSSTDTLIASGSIEINFVQPTQTKKPKPSYP